MFCHKCGSNAIEGSAFCQKCGAKLIQGELQSSVEPVSNTELKAVEYIPSEVLAVPVPTTVPKPVETATVTAEVGKGRNELTIHGYNKIGNFDRKIKVFRNGELVGKVGQGETIIVPNDTDGTFLFRCSPMKAHYTVKAGSGELQIEWDLSKLKVFDLSSDKPLENLEQIRKSNKKWVVAGSILAGICVIAMLIGWFMSDGGTNHVELVRYANPFEDAGITATYEMVIDKYFTSPKWKERKGSDSIWYVDVNGKMAIDGESIKNITLTFKVTPEGNKYLAHTFAIEPYGIDIDGQSGNAEQASSFITALFDAYSQNYESMESYTITTASMSGENDAEYIAQSEIETKSSSHEQIADNDLNEWSIPYADKVRELAAQDGELKFSLIDLTGSGIPALVADYPGYRVSVFTWVDGALITLMKDWPYGAMGNHGYEYLPGGNVIRNYNNDQGGAIVYESYMKANDAHEFVDLNDDGLSVRYFEDTNDNDRIDENENVEEPLYYYGEKEITEKEYASYQIPGDYKSLSGDESAEEILSQLGVETGTEDQAEGEILYKGIPVKSFFDYSMDEATALFGEPTYDGADGNGGYARVYNNEIVFILFADTLETIAIETTSPEEWKVGDISFDKNRAFLIKTFGEPADEYVDEMTQEYTISYDWDGYLLNFILSESSSKIIKISIADKPR